MLESAPSFYSKGNVALQAHREMTVRRTSALRAMLLMPFLRNAARKPIAASLLAFFVVVPIASRLTPARAKEPARSLELSRPVRTWEFLSAVGTRAGLFGNESGRFEAWVYPLKILREFHLWFHVDSRSLPAESLARTIIVRPESTTIVYSGDTFSVRETLFVPVHEAGAVILFDVQTEQPIEIEAAFQRDFQLEWPAALGG